MKQATFNIALGKGLVQRRGFITTLPNMPTVQVTLHDDARLWVCSEYETGAALSYGKRSTYAALRAAERTIDRLGGLDRMLGRKGTILMTNGKANNEAAA